MPDNDFDYYSYEVLSEEEVDEIIANHAKNCTKVELGEYCKVCLEL